MERSSYFIKNRAMFGSFPTQEAVEELEQNGVRYFVNLTYSHERRITPYKTKYNYISFPIKDHQVPEDSREFSMFIITLSEIIHEMEDNHLIYIHCKGGHGRSGIVVASLLSTIFGMNSYQSLELTSVYHNNRKSMREKWRKMGSPQSCYQKNFVHMLYKPIFFFKAYKHGRTAGFSNFSYHAVSIPGFGIFPTSEAAFQAYKDPYNKKYVKSQIRSKSPLHSKYLGSLANVRKDWEHVRNDILFNILVMKFDQHSYLKDNLLSTGLSSIIQREKGNETGQNTLGKLLCSLRSKYYHETN
uniref:Tyrosine specific protein phosphatases domain-containing protein n=1 Tax=viral metagenome TaxID=1070528 RepID=A0A6C0LW24_9ZZZZ